MRRGIDEPLRFHDCWEEIFRILSKYPSLRRDLENALNAKTEKHSIQRCLQWLKAFEVKHLKINTAYLTVESHDTSIRQAAETLAGRVHRAFMEEIGKLKTQNRSAGYRQHIGVSLIHTICQGMEIGTPPIPKPEDRNETTLAASVARLVDPKWWRRKIRTLQARKLETASRYLGAVCKKRGGYCSDATLRRHTHAKQRNRELLEKLEAINDVGQTYTLAELSDLGVSNPVNRRNELMTRIRGCEEFATEFTDYIPVFITQTCPARFHSHHRSGSPYEKWNRSTPREANQYLNEVWARVRAKWKREEITCFGFRVSEPHHDGCPHWHLLLWFPKDQLDLAIAVYRSYALEDSPNEPGASKRRFEVKKDELAKGATGYIAKYISKNVDGLNSDGDAWSLDAVKTATRTEAWARTWGIRQFQPVGGPSVTIYRECRRLTEALLQDQIKDPAYREKILRIQAAADQGDWCAFMCAMGGAIALRKDQPLRAYMVVKKDESGKDATNHYGEVITQLKGIVAFHVIPVITRIYEWVVQPIKPTDEFLDQEAQAPPLVLCQ